MRYMGDEPVCVLLFLWNKILLSSSACYKTPGDMASHMRGENVSDCEWCLRDSWNRYFVTVASPVYAGRGRDLGHKFPTRARVPFAASCVVV